MKELKQEVNAIIDNYDPNADFEDTILKLASVGAAPCGPCGVRFAQAT